MKNADMPAMPMFNDCGAPIHYSSAGFHDECLAGLTKREMFAMHAPIIEPDFESAFVEANKADDDLVLIYETWGCYQLSIKGKMQAMKQWRYAYADSMLGEG